MYVTLNLNTDYRFARSYSSHARGSSAAARSRSAIARATSWSIPPRSREESNPRSAQRSRIGFAWARPTTATTDGPAASFGDPFPDDAELEPGSLAAVIAGTFQRNPRHLVEFKPAIGVVFREYLEPYSHWAFGDLDVLMGDVEAFVDGDEWDDFDVVAYSFGDQWRAYTRGQWTMHRNAEHVNVAYLRCNFLGPRLRKRLEDKAHYESCEGCYSTAVAAARLRTKFVVKHFTDAAQKGDRDAAWVTADGQVRRCLGGGAPCRLAAGSELGNVHVWEVWRPEDAEDAQHARAHAARERRMQLGRGVDGRHLVVAVPLEPRAAPVAVDALRGLVDLSLIHI